MIYLRSVQLRTGIFFHEEKIKEWYNQFYRSFYPSETGKYLYEDLKRITNEFILIGSILTKKDNHQRRLILAQIWHGNHVSMFVKENLIVRLVPNPDKIYQQLDGEYGEPYHVKVIGQSILNDTYTLPAWDAEANQD